MRWWLVLAVLLAACSASPGADGFRLERPGGSADAVPEADQEVGGSKQPGSIFPELRPQPEAEPVPTPAETLAAQGVTVQDGFSPHAHLRDTNGILIWPPREDMPHGIGDPPVPAGLGPLNIEATVELWPLSCVWYLRTVTGVDVGEGLAARRIAREIERVAADEHQDFLSWFSSEEDCEGLEPGSAVGSGHTYQELAEEPCEVPGAAALRCFVLADFGYPAGAAHTYLFHHQLVFDATDGTRLFVDDVLALAGFNPSGALPLATEIVSVVTSTRDPVLRQARPTRDGLVFGFSPYEAGSFAEYTRDVFIPWDVLSGE